MHFGRVNGKAVVGIQSAAKAYYSKSLEMLTEEEYISLVAMIVMPGTFHLRDHPGWNQERVQRIKALVAGQYKPKGFMDQFYGELPREVIEAGLPKFSYFPNLYKN